MNCRRAFLFALAVAMISAGASATGLPSIRPEAATGASKGITIAAAGDVMLDRGVRSAIAQYGNGWPFSSTNSILSSADIAFVNLETSVTDGGRRIPGKGIWFRMSPDWLGIIKDAGIDVVSVANNHVMDYDVASLADTVRNLNEAGIASVGAGNDAGSARMGRIIEAGGMKVGFLAYSDFHDIFWSFSYPRTFGADERKPGIAAAKAWMMREDIARIRKSSDFVVVSVHWGQEYSRMPDSYQVERAHACIEAGADIVLGHHPHVLQPVESYEGGLIFYSLGNFVFDQEFGDTTESMIALIRLRASEVPEAEIIPARISDCRPVPMGPEEARGLLFRLRADSGILGTEIYMCGASGYFSAGSGMPDMLLESLMEESGIKPATSH